MKKLLLIKEERHHLVGLEDHGHRKDGDHQGSINYFGLGYFEGDKFLDQVHKIFSLVGDVKMQSLCPVKDCIRQTAEMGGQNTAPHRKLSRQKNALLVCC